MFPSNIPPSLSFWGTAPLPFPPCFPACFPFTLPIPLRTPGLLPGLFAGLLLAGSLSHAHHGVDDRNLDQVADALRFTLTAVQHRRQSLQFDEERAHARRDLEVVRGPAAVMRAFSDAQIARHLSRRPLPTGSGRSNARGAATRRVEAGPDGG